MKSVGRKTWAIADGHIPLTSHGAEPEFTSNDKLCVLNTSDQEAELEIMIYHSDRDPIGPYQLKVGARRVRHVRFNDLINPQAIPLDEPYAAVIRSSVPVLVQVSRRDTSHSDNALMTTLAFPVDD
jgi:hypothetical protein